MKQHPILVGIASIATPTGPAETRWLEDLSAAERQRIRRFQRPADRWARLAGMHLLRHMLVRMAGDDAATADLHRTPHGRPYLAGRPDLDFNLSHSGKYVLCAASPQHRVGIDVEAHRTIAAQDFRDILPPSLWREVAAAPQPERALINCWTRIEAVAKAEGSGLTAGIRDMVFEGRQARLHDRQWHVIEIPLGFDYSSHLASNHCVARLRVLEFAFEPQHGLKAKKEREVGS